MSETQGIQVVTEIVSLLSQYPLAQMKEYLQQAENDLVNKRTHWSDIDLENMYEEQLKCLKSLGYPTSLWRRFESYKNEIIRKCEKMTFGAGNIPFLFSVPMSIRSMLDQIKDVAQCYECETGDFSLGHFEMLNNLDEGLSYIFDVNISENLKQRHLIEQEVEIKERRRHCLTIADVVSLAIASKIFVDEKMTLFAAETYYGKEKKDATLFLSKFTISEGDERGKVIVKSDVYIDRHDTFKDWDKKLILPTFSERMLIEL